MKFRLILAIILIASISAYSQTKEKKRKESKTKVEIDRGATYGVDREKTKKKKTKLTLNRSFDQKVEEYEKLMAKNAKKNAKIAKEMQKPKYSDPTYFGHKKKPKKRPPGKKKFCKECRMYH